MEFIKACHPAILMLAWLVMVIITHLLINKALGGWPRMESCSTTTDAHYCADEQAFRLFLASLWPLGLFFLLCYLVYMLCKRPNGKSIS